MVHGKSGWYGLTSSFPRPQTFTY